MTDVSNVIYANTITTCLLFVVSKKKQRKRTNNNCFRTKYRARARVLRTILCLYVKNTFCTGTFWIRAYCTRHTISYDIIVSFTNRIFSFASILYCTYGIGFGGWGKCHGKLFLRSRAYEKNVFSKNHFH